jgi:6-phosphogluconate dehydrogenase
MVHNGIEYGLMAAYAEGLNVLQHANVGTQAPSATPRPRRCATPSTTVRHRHRRVAEVWRAAASSASGCWT